MAHLDFSPSSGVNRVKADGMPAITAPCTYEVIFRTSTLGSQVTLLQLDDSVNGANVNSGYIGWDSGNYDQFQFVGQDDSSFWRLSELAASELADGQEHTLTIRITEPSAGSYTVWVFLDGVFQGDVSGLSASEIPTLPNGGTLHIGDREDAHSVCDYVGDILEVRVWGDARSDTEISNNTARGSVGGGAAGIQALYLLDTDTGTVLEDAGPGGYDGAIQEGNGVTWVSANQPPTASFSYAPSHPDAGEQVSFDGTDSSDPDGSVAQYDWDFGDGTVLTDAGPTPTHEYTAEGEYTVTLTVTDGQGATDTMQKTVSVGLDATFTLPASGPHTDPITPDASGSMGAIQSYDWLLTGPNGWNGSYRGISPTIDLPYAGDYQVQLTVTDDQGNTDSATQAYTADAGLWRKSRSSGGFMDVDDQADIDEFDPSWELDTTDGTYATPPSGAPNPPLDGYIGLELGEVPAEFIGRLTYKPNWGDQGAGFALEDGTRIILQTEGSDAMRLRVLDPDGNELANVVPGFDRRDSADWPQFLAIHHTGSRLKIWEHGSGFSWPDSPDVDISHSHAGGVVQAAAFNTGQGSVADIRITNVYAMAAEIAVEDMLAGLEVAGLSYYGETPASTDGETVQHRGTHSKGILPGSGSRTLEVREQDDNPVLATYQEQDEDWILGGDVFVYGGTNPEYEPPEEDEKSPIASFSWSPATPEVGEDVFLDGGASYDPDGSIASYRWEVEGHGTLGPSEFPEPGSVKWFEAGTYRVTLYVTDDQGNTDSLTHLIEVEDPAAGNQPPVPKFTWSPAQPKPGEDITLDPSNSSDPDGSIVEYSWSIEDHGLIQATQNPVVSWPEAGEYLVTLHVTDDAGETSNLTQYITVTDAPPENEPPVADATATPENPATGESVTLDGSGSHDPDGSIVDFTWDVEDHGKLNGSQHTVSWPEAGTYRATLIVTDDDGATDSETLWITVGDGGDEGGGGGGGEEGGGGGGGGEPPPEPNIDAEIVKSGQYFEVWDAPVPQAGEEGARFTRLAIFRDLAEATATRREGRVDTLRLTTSLDDPAAEHVDDYRLIRTQSIYGTDPELWRVLTHRKVHGSDGALQLEVEAEALWGDLGRASLVADVLDNATYLTFGRVGYTPEEAMQLALDAYDGRVAFKVGTVELTEAMELLQVDKDTPLSLLRKVAEAADGWLEFQFDEQLIDNGDGTYLQGYRIHLRDASQLVWEGGPEVRVGKNLASLSDEKDGEEGATRVYGAGQQGLVIAQADWEVVAVAGDSITLRSPDGRAGPVPADGWLVGTYVRDAGDPSQTAYEVASSSGSLDGDSVLEATGSDGAFSVGDRVAIMDANGKRLPYIDHPTAEPEHGPVIRTVEASNLSPVANKIRNPATTDWPQGQEMPTDWTKIGGPTVSRYEHNERVQFGTQAVRISASAEGDGLKSSPFPFRKTDRQPVLNGVIDVILWAGEVEMYLEHVDTGDVYPASSGPAYAKYGDQDTDPLRFRLSANDGTDAPEGDYRLVVRARTDDADFAVDAATAAATNYQLTEIVLGGGPHELWRRVARTALQESEPPHVYDVELAHLYRLDPITYADEKLEVGAPMRVFDELTDTAAVVRITGVTERLDSTKAEGKVRLSDARRDTRRLLEEGEGFDYSVLGGGRRPEQPTELQAATLDVVKPPGLASAGSVEIHFKALRPDGTEITSSDPSVAPTATRMSDGTALSVSYDSQAGHWVATGSVPTTGDTIKVEVPATVGYKETSTMLTTYGAEESSSRIEIVQPVGARTSAAWTLEDLHFKCYRPDGTEITTEVDGEAPTLEYLRDGDTRDTVYDAGGYYRSAGSMTPAKGGDVLRITLPATADYPEALQDVAIGHPPSPMIIGLMTSTSLQKKPGDGNIVQFKIYEYAEIIPRALYAPDDLQSGEHPTATLESDGSDVPLYTTDVGSQPDTHTRWHTDTDTPFTADPEGDALLIEFGAVDPEYQGARLRVPIPPISNRATSQTGSVTATGDYVQLELADGTIVKIPGAELA